MGDTTARESNIAPIWCRRQPRRTRRAPDKWDSARFLSMFLASVYTALQPFPRPTHLPVTPAVSLPWQKI